MSNSKIDRAKYGPGMLEVLFGAFLSLLLGAVLAVCYLIAQPVQIGKTPDKEQPTSPVVYIKGNQDEDRAKQWLRKKQLFTENSSVEVNEDELNAWITAGTVPGRQRRPTARNRISRPMTKSRIRKPRIRNRNLLPHPRRPRRAPPR